MRYTRPTMTLLLSEYEVGNGSDSLHWLSVIMPSRKMYLFLLGISVPRFFFPPPPPSLFHFLPFLYFSNTSPSVRLYLGQVPTDIILLSISFLLNCPFLSSPSSRTFSPVFQSALLCSLVSQPCTCTVTVEWHWSDYDITPPLLFCFILLFITISCTGFYSFNQHNN